MMIIALTIMPPMRGFLALSVFESLIKTQQCAMDATQNAEVLWSVVKGQEKDTRESKIAFSNQTDLKC